MPHMPRRTYSHTQTDTKNVQYTTHKLKFLYSGAKSGNISRPISGIHYNRGLPQPLKWPILLDHTHRRKKGDQNNLLNLADSGIPPPLYPVTASKKVFFVFFFFLYIYHWCCALREVYICWFCRDDKFQSHVIIVPILRAHQGQAMHGRTQNQQWQHGQQDWIRIFCHLLSWFEH